MDGITQQIWYVWERNLSGSNHFSLSVDGGWRQQSDVSGAGWCLSVWQKHVERFGNIEKQKIANWKKVYEGFKRFKKLSSAIDSELNALEGAISALQTIVRFWNLEHF